MSLILNQSLYYLHHLIKIQKNNNYILINLGKLINQQVTKSATKNRRIEYKQTQANAPMKKSQEGGGEEEINKKRRGEAYKKGKLPHAIKAWGPM